MNYTYMYLYMFGFAVALYLLEDIRDDIACFAKIVEKLELSESEVTFIVIVGAIVWPIGLLSYLLERRGGDK